MYTSAVMESMKLKRQQFTRKSENDAWEILSRITQEEVMNNVISLEDANRLVSTKLANIQTIQRAVRKATEIPPNNVRWSDRNFADYFFMRYQQRSGKAHPRIKMKTAESCVYMLRKYCNSDDDIRAHIDAFFEAYTGKDNYDPKIMLVGNLENIYQVQFYQEHGVLASEHVREETQNKKSYTI